jgi:hypothetical protein
MVSKDSLGDRMKAYESLEADHLIDAEVPLVVRLDGRAFSTFTRGMNKPFDARLFLLSNYGPGGGPAAPLFPRRRA